MRGRVMVLVVLTLLVLGVLAGRSRATPLPDAAPGAGRVVLLPFCVVVAPAGWWEWGVDAHGVVVCAGHNPRRWHHA